MHPRFRILFVAGLAVFTLSQCSQIPKPNTQDNAPQQVIAYYAGNGDQIAAFDLQGVDQLIYSFLHLQGNELAVDNAEDSISLRKIIAQKERYPNLKVLISLGGWGGCETCSEVFNTAEGREEFARSTAAIIETYQADGIDLDWEYPAISGYPGHLYQEADRPNFTEVVRLLRQYMQPDDILSFAAGASSRFLEQSVDWEAVTPLVDNINIMSYDFVGSGSDQTGHHTSLFASSGQNRSADTTIRALIERGVPPQKIIIGAAFYIKTFKEVGDSNHGLFQPAVFNRSYNQMDFEALKPQFEFFWDAEAQAPYAYDKNNKLFATFDDPTSIKAKVQYAKDLGLGGIMFWQLMNDKPQEGLLQVMVDAMKGNP
ncbi:MAG: glycosyl hydrolase family 18 protein [Flavobacteriaceae bacterium]